MAHCTMRDVAQTTVLLALCVTLGAVLGVAAVAVAPHLQFRGRELMGRI